MANNLRSIKLKIKSAKNIGKITKAMQLVAAAKMKKAQKKAFEAKPFSEIIAKITTSLMTKTNYHKHPLLKSFSNDNRPLLILISTNKGLCGSLNINLQRNLSKFISQKTKTEKAIFDFAILGKKGNSFVLKLGGGFLADFSDIIPFSQAVGSITKQTAQRFIEGKNTSIWIAYNSFVNALKQKPTIKKILPLNIPAVSNSLIQDKKVEYLIEPSPKKIVDFLLPLYLEIQVREAVLSAGASEYSARMIAMKNATDNALELVTNFTLSYNKIRQQAITTEIADIVTAKIGVEGK